MKKTVFVLLIICLTITKINAQNVFKTYEMPHNGILYNNQYYDDIGMLEHYTFNKKYLNDNNLARLQRLEMQAFGALQQGDFNTRYQNVRSAILARPKHNYRKSVFRNAGDYFSGQLTGFTPTIVPYSVHQGYPQSFNPINIYPQYERQYQTNYSSPFRNGYRINNRGVSSAAGVKILD